MTEELTVHRVERFQLRGIGQVGIDLEAAALVGAGLSGRRIAAMVVNDNACEPDKRGALESIAGKPAPTGAALSVFFGIAVGLITQQSVGTIQ
jgi:hypothetical protein